MIPHFCKVKHDPPHSYGDCLRACIASLCNIQNVDHVPHFYDDGDDERGALRLREFLATRGYFPFYMGLQAGNTTSIENIFKMMSEINTDVEYLLFCQCGGGDHVVICRNAKVIHNPAWYNSPISGPCENGFWVIVVMVPINP